MRASVLPGGGQKEAPNPSSGWEKAKGQVKNWKRGRDVQIWIIVALISYLGEESAEIKALRERL